MLQRLRALRQRQSVIASFAVPKEIATGVAPTPDLLLLEQTLKQDIANLTCRWQARRSNALHKARGRAWTSSETSAAA